MKRARTLRCGLLRCSFLWLGSFLAFAVLTVLASIMVCGVVALGTLGSYLLCRVVIDIMSAAFHISIVAPMEGGRMVDVCWAVTTVVLLVVSVLVGADCANNPSPCRTARLEGRMIGLLWGDFWRRTNRVLWYSFLMAGSTIIISLLALFAVAAITMVAATIGIAAAMLSELTVTILNCIPGVAIDYPPTGAGGWTVFGIWFVLAIPLVLLGIYSPKVLIESRWGRLLVVGWIAGIIYPSPHSND